MILNEARIYSSGTYPFVPSNVFPPLSKLANWAGIRQLFMLVWRYLTSEKSNAWIIMKNHQILMFLIQNILGSSTSSIQISDRRTCSKSIDEKISSLSLNLKSKLKRRVYLQLFQEDRSKLSCTDQGHQEDCIEDHADLQLSFGTHFSLRCTF